MKPEQPVACRQIRCLGAFRKIPPIASGCVLGCFVDEATGKRGDTLAEELGLRMFLTTAVDLAKETGGKP